MNFETAPFKMTAEYVELMGGYSSDAFRTFEDLLIKGFFAIKRNIENICAIEQVRELSAMFCVIFEISHVGCMWDSRKFF